MAVFGSWVSHIDKFSQHSIPSHSLWQKKGGPPKRTITPEALPYKHWHRGGGGATPGGRTSGYVAQVSRGTGGARTGAGGTTGSGVSSPRPRSVALCEQSEWKNGAGRKLRYGTGITGEWGGSTHRNNLPRLGGQTPDVGALWGATAGHWWGDRGGTCRGVCRTTGC